jgi:non-heme chloroperoxidase
MTDLDEVTKKPISRRTILTGTLGTAVGAAVSTAVATEGILSSPAFALDTHKDSEGAQTMSTVPTKDGLQIFYKDWGHGQPIVFHHGWPLSSDDWDAQMLFFVQHGYRVVGIDRRGHGRSSQVSDGHDMDHYAADTAAVVEHLDLQHRSYRPFHRRRRSGPLCRAPRQGPGRKAGADVRRAADHGEVVE